MTTWMLYKSMGRTFETLVNADLVSAIQDTIHIFDVVTGAAEAEKPSHPIYKMWEDNPCALGIYGMMAAMELTVNRGVADKQFFVLEKAMIETKSVYSREGLGFTFEKPLWFEDIDVLRSHRSNLVRRRRDYKKTWSKIEPLMPYLWPVPNEEEYDLYISKGDKALLKRGERKLPRAIADRVVNL